VVRLYGPQIDRLAKLVFANVLIDQVCSRFCNVADQHCDGLPLFNREPGVLLLHMRRLSIRDTVMSWRSVASNAAP
jgi:hypothetical protein